MNAKLAFIAVVPLAAGGLYLATFPPEWPWHPAVASVGIAATVFLGLRAIFRKRK